MVIYPLSIIFCSVFLSLMITGALVFTRVNTQTVAAILGVMAGVIMRMFVFLPPEFFQFVWDPWNVLVLYYPFIILKLVYGMDYNLYKKAKNQILLILLIGYPMTIFSTGFILALIWGSTLEPMTVMILGLVPTPVDVPDYVFKVEHMKTLEVFLVGEAILGNGVALTLLEMGLGCFDGVLVTWYHITFFLIRSLLMAIILGLSVGKFLASLFKVFYNDNLNACTFLICSTYLPFFICDRLIFCNGTITSFLIVLCIAREKKTLSRKVSNYVDNFLEVSYFIIVRIGYFVMLIATTYHMVPLSRPWTVLEAIILYVAATAVRGVMYTLLSPVLSRMGHGFGFTSLVTLFWAPKKGPAQIIMLRIIFNHPIKEYLGATKLTFWYYHILYVTIINVSTVNIIMKNMGILELSAVRRNNIQNCFRFVNLKRMKQIMLLKMNRFYSGVNWPLIYTTTALMSLRGGDTSHDPQDSNKFEAICPICLNEIPMELSKEDILELSRQARLRILKTQKVSFICQYEEEFIDEECVKLLLRTCDSAMDTEELMINLDNLYYQLRNKRLSGPLRSMQSLFSFKQEYFKMPLTLMKRRCYRMAASRWFDICVYIIIVINLIWLILDEVYIDHVMQWMYGVFIKESFFWILYFIEFVIKVLAHSYVNVKQGLRNYFRFVWNRLDFIVLIMNTIELIGFCVACWLYFSGKEVDLLTILRVAKCTKAIRLVRIFKILGNSFPKITAEFEKAIDQKLAAAYSMGTGMMIGYDEVLDTLCSITDNPKLRESLRAMLLADKSAIAFELGNLHNEKPWVVINLRTKQAITVILKSMHDALQELKMAGLLTMYEYRQLAAVLEVHRKNARTLSPVSKLPPKSLLKETTWMSCDYYSDEEVYQLIHKKVIMKVWDANEVVCNEGDHLGGIYVLITGLFKSIYIPSETFIEDLMVRGMLPVKDYIRNQNFSEYEENYILVGNTIGELSVMTGRPYSCKIITELPSQAFIIPMEVIEEAKHLSDDPVFGLECRIWKSISMNLVRRILKATTLYSTKTNMELNLILNRAFVPNLDCFLLFATNEYIADIILIEGLIVDYTTREVLTAPAYIPRYVHKIRLTHKGTDHSNRTKILIIPVEDADEYDVILNSEAKSELVPNHSNTCLLINKNFRKRQQKKHAVRNMFQAISNYN